MKVLQLERKQFNCLNATEKNSLHCHLINTTAKQGPFQQTGKNMTLNSYI